MSAFVEECRREWKRLGVPDLLAEEMATELEADLAEAEADGVSTVEMLGESDPRRFAAAWASERGLVSEPVQETKRRRVWPWVVVAFVLLCLFLISFAFIGVGSGQLGSAPQVQVTPLRRVSVPNVIGMKACKAVRIVAGTGVDDWRVLGHEHGYSCDLVVVEQTPAPGHVIRRHVTMTLRLGRS